MRSSDTLCFVLRRALQEPVRPVAPLPPRIGKRMEEQRLPVSVVIPTYNRAGMLRRALESVAAQRPRLAAEVIVVDDGSDDGTAEVALQAGARLVQHQRNLGLSAARNTGVETASHEWIAFLDSDDEWLPHHLATLWPHRDAHVLLASAALRCRTDSVDDRFQGPVAHRFEVHKAPNALIFPGNCVCVSTAMILRSAVRAAGGFRSHDGLVEDLDLWIRLLENGTALFLPIVTINYHLHGEQMSMQDLRAMQIAHVAAAVSYDGHAWYSRRDVERWKATANWDNAEIALREGRYIEAAREACAILTHGNRVVGLMGMWLWRLLIRRRGSEVDRDGGPSIAVLPNDWSDHALKAISEEYGLRVRDHRTVAGAVLALIRHPTGVAFVGSWWQVQIARLLRVRSCVNAEEARQLFPPRAARAQSQTGRQSPPQDPARAGARLSTVELGSWTAS